MKGSDDRSKRETCLDEMQITRYVLHQCPAKERREIERHLVECPLCRSEVVHLTKAQPEIQDETQWKELPGHLFRKGMEIVRKMKKVSAETSPLEICLGFIRDQWEILRHTGTMIPQPVMALRKDSPDKKTVTQTVVKEFNGFRVEVNIKGSKEGTVDLLIRVKGSEDDSLIQSVQFTLKDERKQRTLEERTEDGEILFEGLEPGLFSIGIVLKEWRIGEIKLDVT